MTITIGWWAIPAAITVAALAYAFWPQRAHGFGADVVGAICLLGAIIVSLVAWLIWALLA